MKPHGRDCPDHCSQCLGVPVRRVELDANAVTVDGAPAGRIGESETRSRKMAYARRGGVQAGQRSKG